MASEVTKKYKKRAIVYTILAYVLTYGIALFLVIYGIAGFKKTSAVDVQETFGSFGKTLVSLGMTIVIALVLSLIVKDKLTPTVWMFNIIMSCYLFNKIVMIIIFLTWVAHNYVLCPLAHYNAGKFTINREIDKRE